MEDYNTDVRYDRNEKILNSSSPDNTSKNTNELKLLIDTALKQGLDVDIKDVSGLEDFLLHYAVKNKFCDIVEFLLEKVANPDIQSYYDDTTLHFIASKDKSTKGRELLFNKDALIELAVRTDNTEMVQLLVANKADLNPESLSNYIYKNKSLIELVPSDKPELKAFLKLAIACNNNDFSIVDKSVTTEDIQKFTEGKISAKPENPKFFSKHLNELYHLKDLLLSKEEFKKSEFIEKIDNHLNSYSTLKNLLMFKMVEQPKIYKYEAGILPEDLENNLKDYGLKLTGDVKIEESHSEA
ncbi:MAG: ankyrin repeat domain-containing protein [Rickettsia endosymbiont of Pentastiridius leporinus]